MEDALKHTESLTVNFWMLFNHPDRAAELLQMLPAAIGLIGLVLVFLLLITGGGMHGLRWATVILYAAGAGLVGWMLAEASEPLTWLDHARWIALAAPALLIALSAIPKKAARFTAIVLALIIAIPTSGAIGVGLHTVEFNATENLQPGEEHAPTKEDQPKPDADQQDPVNPTAKDQSNDTDSNKGSNTDSREQDQGASFFGIPLQP